MRLSEEGRVMGKLETRADLYNQIAPQKAIISDAGKGSRKANTAQKKIEPFKPSPPKKFWNDGKPFEQPEPEKAWTPKEPFKPSPPKKFWNYEKNYANSVRKAKKTEKEETNKNKGGYVKKYAKGGGVRKVRS
jgi:hypothetical protein